MAARGFLGSGDLYIARYVNGAFEDYRGPFECEKFEIKPNSELKEKVSKGRSTYGQVVESVPVPQPADLTVDLGEVNKEALALALFGTTAALTQGSGTLSNEAVVTKLDYWKPLTKAKLTPTTVVVTNVAGSTTYVEGTDYLVNYQLGWVKTLTGGAIADASTIHVDATYEAITGDEIKGMTQTQVRAKFKFDGKNFADDLPVIVTVHEAIIAADSAFDFLADDFATLSLPGRMKTPAGFTEPFTVHMRNA
jgi:hypothetical protein